MSAPRSSRPTKRVRSDALQSRRSSTAASDDIVYSSLFTGVHGNYLKGSIRNAGLDPDNLAVSDASKMNFGGAATKAWKDIWGCGQGISAVDKVVPARELIARLRREYEMAKQRLIPA